MPRSKSNISPERNCWYKMRYRCLNSKSPEYDKYGGRGIQICAGWGTFQSFHADLGNKPSPEYSIDRINNNGHYSCGKCNECIKNGWSMNCRWATPLQQSNNTRRNVRITKDGKTLTVTEWAKEMNVSVSTLRVRSARGLSLQEIIAPVKKRKAGTKGPMPYSRVAMEFQASLQVGDQFTSFAAPANVVTVDGLLRKYANPDDCMYWLKDEQGQLLEPVRCWWLRKCCTKVGRKLQEIMPRVQDREATTTNER